MAFLLSLTELASFSCRAAVNRSTHRKTRVCSKVTVRDGETRVIRVSDPVRNPGTVLYPLLSPPEMRGSSSNALLVEQQRKGDGGDKQKYYVNLGYAIRTLREEFPVVFYKEPSFDIYRDDIVFKDPFNTFSGIENYKLIFWALRLNGRIFFKTLWIDLVSVWQPAENVIMIRWTAHGIPRVPWESRGRFDGTSEYKLDKDGKIYEHRVDNVAINNPSKFRVRAMEELILSLGCPSIPRPTCFESVSYYVISYMPFLVRFTWVRYYLALHITLAWRSADRF